MHHFLFFTDTKLIFEDTEFIFTDILDRKPLEYFFLNLLSTNLVLCFNASLLSEYVVCIKVYF